MKVKVKLDLSDAYDNFCEFDYDPHHIGKVTQEKFDKFLLDFDKEFKTITWMVQYNPKRKVISISDTGIFHEVPSIDTVKSILVHRHYNRQSYIKRGGDDIKTKLKELLSIDGGN